MLCSSSSANRFIDLHTAALSEWELGMNKKQSEVLRCSSVLVLQSLLLLLVSQAFYGGFEPSIIVSHALVLIPTEFLARFLFKKELQNRKWLAYGYGYATTILAIAAYVYGRGLIVGATAFLSGVNQVLPYLLIGYVPLCIFLTASRYGAETVQGMIWRRFGRNEVAI